MTFRDIDGDVVMDDTALDSPTFRPNPPTALFGANLLQTTNIREYYGLFGPACFPRLRTGEGLYSMDCNPAFLPSASSTPTVARKAPAATTKASAATSKAPTVASKPPTVAPKAPTTVPKAPTAVPKAPTVAPKATTVTPKASAVASKAPGSAAGKATVADTKSSASAAKLTSSTAVKTPATPATKQSTTAAGKSPAVAAKTSAATSRQLNVPGKAKSQRPTVSFALTPQQMKDQKRKGKPSYQVLNQQKLVGKICEHLSSFQLFTVQRTSKTFRKAVTDSESLQRKMLLRRDPKAKANNCSPPNPVLASSIFLPSLAMQYGIVEGIHLACGQLTSQWEFRREYDIEHPAPVTHKCIDLSNREASWRKMLVHRGELHDVFPSLVMLYRHKHQLTWNKKTQCKSHKGDFTLGEVLDAMEGALEKYWEWRIAGQKLPKAFKDAVAKSQPREWNARR